MAMNDVTWLRNNGYPASDDNLEMVEMVRDAGAYLRRRAYREFYRSPQAEADCQAWQKKNQDAYAAEECWFATLQHKAA